MRHDLCRCKGGDGLCSYHAHKFRLLGKRLDLREQRRAMRREGKPAPCFPQRPQWRAEAESPNKKGGVR